MIRSVASVFVFLSLCLAALSSPGAGLDTGWRLWSDAQAAWQNDPLYLPGNGGLLFATTLMAVGWKGAPYGHAPGFPTPDKGWTVGCDAIL